MAVNVMVFVMTPCLRIHRKSKESKERDSAGEGKFAEKLRRSIGRFHGGFDGV